MDPEGREAVERQTVSGWGTWPLVRACVNQVWNCVKGLGWSWERSRRPLVYWSAWVVVVGWAPAGATVQVELLSGNSSKRDGVGWGGGHDLQISFESLVEAMLRMEKERGRVLSIRCND